MYVCIVRFSVSCIILRHTPSTEGLTASYHALNQFLCVSMLDSCYDNVTQVSFLFASWEPCNAAAGFNKLDSYLLLSS